MEDQSLALAAKITQGTFRVAEEIAGEGIWVEGGNPDEPDEICHCTVSSLFREEAQANAELIVEAFNVTNETGRTPRQLAEDRQELQDALRQSQDLLAEAYHHARSGSLLWEHFPRVNARNLTLLLHHKQ